MSVDIAANATALFSLSEKIAVVTGAAVGIGRGIAIQLAELGATVAVTARDIGAAQRVVDQIAQIGGSARAFVLDVDDENSVVSAFAQIRTAFGGVDILVNNAGIFPAQSLLESSCAEWDAVQRTNTRGTLLCLREAGKLMRDGGRGGRIINISSMGALRSAVPGRTAYNASKAAVNRLTAEASLELAPYGIQVNAVMPGPTATEKLDRDSEQGATMYGRIARKVPLNRWGTPLDIAGAVAFFASPAASFVTGQALAVCGGAAHTM
jgi:NAD(P)-dependent dehydrogenase (short-subunit alcohol dehydrogenase family)